MENTSVTSVSSGHPTHWPTDPAKLPDCIDFFLIKAVASNYTETMVKNDLSSDHSPVFLSVNVTPPIRKKTIALTTRRTDWDHFRTIISNRTNLLAKIRTRDELDQAVIEFTDLLVAAAKEATPSSIPPIGNQVSYITREVKEGIRTRRKLRHQWQTTRDPEIKRKFNRFCKRVQDLFRQNQNATFSEFLSSLDPTESTNYSLYKVAKAARKPPSFVSPLRTGQSWASSDADKSTLFAHHLERTFTPHDFGPTTAPTWNAEDGERIAHITPKEIRQIIQKLKKREAPGHDLISATILSQLPCKGFCRLGQIYNAVLRLQYFPSLWKTARIIMVPKAGKPEEEVTSYRPISLLSTMSKVMEKLIYRRLLHVINQVGAHTRAPIWLP